ncbi:MAG TPA: Crp/Fnr family transcriptional regulator [Pyrinomonadaceae bacterium]|nr:Crp/Fnr family transcriptional regulator [Pyrinomonadaceae bacterium]
MSDPAVSPTRVGNLLLGALPPVEFKRLAPHLKCVTLRVGQILKEADEPALDVYFPLNAVISLITVMENGMTLECGVVGREGVVGLSAFLGGGPTPNQQLVQVPGTALKLPGSIMAHEYKRGGRLQELLSTYTLATLIQISQSVACNRIHSAEERLCRWLLMMSDRADTVYFPHTQEFLAQMLGAARPVVTTAAGALQKAGLIKYSRGNLTILNRTGLESASCECYAKVAVEFDRLLGGNHADAGAKDAD